MLYTISTCNKAGYVDTLAIANSMKNAETLATNLYDSLGNNEKRVYIRQYEPNILYVNVPHNIAILPVPATGDLIPF